MNNQELNDLLNQFLFLMESDKAKVLRELDDFYKIHKKDKTALSNFIRDRKDFFENKYLLSAPQELAGHLQGHLFATHTWTKYSEIINHCQVLSQS
ncbi:hypothetical protein [Aequorivita sinensis]|uniref:hypothetical protein n=1 Tax=Aequorivita sinensis TaxID=1382458 RepID=UPI00111ECC63|nr:hypothetical protein [Aequorivita sinensis]